MSQRSGYGAILNSHGIQFVSWGVWLSVGRAARPQGWKLHLSSIPVEAEFLLKTVLPVLSARGVAFKIARDVSILIQLNSGELGATQVGKFITIYPPSDQQARELADTLVLLTATYKGPRIPSDAHISGIVYSRYGAMAPTIVENRLGQKTAYITGKDGQLVRDTYSIPYVPEVSTWPFATPCPTTMSLMPQRMVGPGYRLASVIAARATGAIFLAMDLRSQETARLVAVKLAFPFTHSDLDGRDARDRLANEARALKALAPCVEGIPHYHDLFSEEDRAYLVLEYADGRPFSLACAEYRQDLRFRQLKPQAQRQILDPLIALAKILRRIHRQGYVHRDVSANNLLLASSNRLYLLDFEISWRVGDHAPPFQTGTLGFMSPQQQGRHARPTVADDVYGFGAVAFFALTGIDPVIMVGLSYAQRKRMIEDVLGEAAPISAMIADCMHPSATKRASLTTIESSLERACAVASMPRSTKRLPSRITGTSLERAIHSGLSGLNNSVLVDSASGL